MKKGPEYERSREKAAVNYFVAGPAYPLLFIPGRFAVRKLITRGQWDTLFDQKRVGVDGKPFNIHKFQTKVPGTEVDINPLATFWRKHGFDEFGQIKNIIEGTMSVVARRPILHTEFAELMGNLSPVLQQRYTKLVLPTRPGIISTYGIDYHVGFDPSVDQFEARAESDIKDVVDGSIVYDFSLISRLVQEVAGRRFN